MLELEKASVGGWDFLPEAAARALLWSHRMVSSSDCEPPKYMPYALALGSITFALNVTHDSGGGDVYLEGGRAFLVVHPWP